MILLTAVVATLAAATEDMPERRVAEVVSAVRERVGQPIAIVTPNRPEALRAQAMLGPRDYVFARAGSPSETRLDQLGVACAIFLTRNGIGRGEKAWSVTAVGACEMPAPPPILALDIPPAPMAHQPFSMGRYRGGMQLATAGVVLVPVGVGMVVGGAVAVYTVGPEEGAIVGLGVAAVGALAVVVGPPMAAAGSLQSAHALRRAGVEVSTGWGTASLVLYAGTVVFPGAYVVSVAAALVQMSEDTAALLDSGLAAPRFSVTLVPWTNADVRGLALVGSF